MKQVCVTKRFNLGSSKLLHWCRNERDIISNQRRLDCLLNRLFGCISKKTSKIRVTGLCEGNSPATREFPAQRASNAENVFTWWRHHVSVACSRSTYYHTNTGVLLISDLRGDFGECLIKWQNNISREINLIMWPAICRPFLSLSMYLWPWLVGMSAAGGALYNGRITTSML